MTYGYYIFACSKFDGVAHSAFFYAHECCYAKRAVPEYDSSSHAATANHDWLDYPDKLRLLR